MLVINNNWLKKENKRLTNKEKFINKYQNKVKEDKGKCK